MGEDGRRELTISPAQPMFPTMQSDVCEEEEDRLLVNRILQRLIAGRNEGPEREGIGHASCNDDGN